MKFPSKSLNLTDRIKFNIDIRNHTKLQGIKLSLKVHRVFSSRKENNITLEKTN